ncbi:hypothetical protein CGC20_3825 [Leishmania donovani]|uniref:EF-hand domain-containing protein n=1 Tax=Leishmania donovani TaxID=5661 RepID=A0A504X1K6_LEIDO|nr:hypothetical protein CGC20_3825 [Leishmania donovani]
MLSDTESLGFVEEDSSPPLSRQPTKAPVVVPKRPRINTMPRLHSPSLQTAKAAGAKPPLHSSASGAAAGGTAAHPSQSAAASKPAKVDVMSDSDTDSILFAVEDGSAAGMPARSSTSSMALPAARQNLISAAPAGLAKRLSHTGSIGSIQFNSEPGSRRASPGPKARLNPRASTPVEKAEARAPLLSSVRCCAPTDTSISFIEHGSESIEFGFSPLAQPETEKCTAPVTNSALPLPPLSPVSGEAAPAGTAGRHSTFNEDSIAFQTEDESDFMQSIDTPALPQNRSLVAMNSGSIPARRDGRSISVLESCAGDSVDNDSIAFMLEDDTNDKNRQLGATVAYPLKRDTGTPKLSSSHHSHSLHSRPPSRPLSPSIRFDIENTGNESAVERSDPLFGGRGTQPLAADSLPVFGRCSTPTSSPIPDALPSSSNAALGSTAGVGALDAAGEAGTTATPSPTASQPTKKTIVTNRLQQPKNQHSRLPQPRKRAPTPVVRDAELSPARSATHPPLYQRAAVSTPLDAQASGAPSVSPTGGSKSRSASLSDRNVSRKKGARVPLPPRLTHEEQRGRLKRRSKESSACWTTSESPNHRLVTEEGSTGSMDSPPEALVTGARSHTSTAAASATASPTQEIQMAFPEPAGQRAPHSSVQVYSANREVENQYYRHHQQLNRDSNPLTADDHAYPLEMRGELVTGAFEEAEQWRQFNERQRAELVELRKRIAIARRQDRTLLESSPSHEREALMPTPSSLRFVPQPTPMGGGYSSRRSRSQRALHQAEARDKDAKRGGVQGKPFREARGTSPPTGSARRLQASFKGAHAPAAAAKPSPCPAHRTGPAVSPPSPYPRATSAMHGVPSDIIAQSAAAASVADLLGILWPPRTSAADPSLRRSQAIGAFVLESGTPAVDLYFLNGSRLTPEQVARFLDLVRVQRDAEPHTGAAAPTRASVVGAMETLSPTTLRPQAAPSSLTVSAKRGGNVVYVDPADLYAFGRSIPLSLSPARDSRAAPLSAKLTALLPKKAIRRSRVLREVFDAMDLKRQGSIALHHLPSLARLFEVELASIEHTRESLLQGNAVPLRSLLESAVVSRQLHATSWRGARENVAAGVQKGLGAVNGVALDYAGLTRDEQASLTHLTHRLLLLSFAVNVVIPIASASRIPLLDFSTLSMIVYAAVDNVDQPMGSPKGEWRQVVQQYFIALAA